MTISLRPLNSHEADSVYQMFFNMPVDENGLENKAAGMTRPEFDAWCHKKTIESSGVNLQPNRVAQTHYILFENDIPIGVSKLRHSLTEGLLKRGGHIGYGIIKEYRGKGYGQIMLKEILKEAKKMGIDSCLLTTNEDNMASRKVIEKNGGILEHIADNETHYWVSTKQRD